MTTFATGPLAADAWTRIVDGASVSNALIQLRGTSPAHIYVGVAAPDGDETAYLTISHAVFAGVALALGAGESVWARAATSIAATLEGDGTAR